MFITQKKNLKSGTIAFLGATLLGGLITPLIVPQSAQAQLFPTRTSVPVQNNYQVTIPVGTTIPLMYETAEKIIVAKGETLDITLQVAANVKDRRGNILIPYGSDVKGKIQPSKNGTQFVAKTLVINGKEQRIDGKSEVVTRTEKIKKGADTGDILEGAAIGAAAAAIVSGVTGDRKLDVLAILGGAGLGALGGWALGSSQDEVLVMNSDTDLNINLTQSITMDVVNSVNSNTARY